MGFDARGRLTKVRGAKTPRVAVAPDGTTVVNPNNSTLREFLDTHRDAVEVVFRDPMSSRRARAVAEEIAAGTSNPDRYGAFVAPLDSGLIGQGAPMARKIVGLRRIAYDFSGSLDVRYAGRPDAELMTLVDIHQRLDGYHLGQESWEWLGGAWRTGGFDAPTALTLYERGTIGRGVLQLVPTGTELLGAAPNNWVDQAQALAARGYPEAAVALYRLWFQELSAARGADGARRLLDAAEALVTDPDAVARWEAYLAVVTDGLLDSVRWDVHRRLWSPMTTELVWARVVADARSDSAQRWLDDADWLAMPSDMVDELDVAGLLSVEELSFAKGELGHLGADRSRVLALMLARGAEAGPSLDAVRAAEDRDLERLAVVGAGADIEAFNEARGTAWGLRTWLAYRFGLRVEDAGQLARHGRTVRNWASLPPQAMRDMVTWLAGNEDAGSLALRVVDVFGKTRSGQWRDRCRRMGISGHDASHWLPNIYELDQEARSSFAAYAIHHLGASGDAVKDLSRLRSVANSWADLDEAERAMSPVKLLAQLKAQRSGALAGTSIGEVMATYDIGKRRVARAAPLWIEGLNVPSWVPAESGTVAYGEGAKYLRWEFLPRTDATGLFLGEATDCCQSIGQAGEACAVHGQTRPSGAFWVCRDRDGSIVAQAWVWLDREGRGVCFDNIERLEPKGQRKATSARALAVRSCLEEAAASLVAHGAGEVTLGTNMTTIDLTGFGRAEPLEPFQYHGYRDSRNQVLIAEAPRGSGAGSTGPLTVTMRPASESGAADTPREVLHLAVSGVSADTAGAEATVTVTGDPGGRRLTLTAPHALDEAQAQAVAEWVRRTGQTATAAGPGGEVLVAALRAADVGDTIEDTEALLGTVPALRGPLEGVEVAVRSAIVAAPDFGRGGAGHWDGEDHWDHDDDDYWGGDNDAYYGWDNSFRDGYGSVARGYLDQAQCWQEIVLEFPDVSFADALPSVRPGGTVFLTDYPDIPPELVGTLAGAGLPPASSFLVPVMWGTEPGAIDPYQTVRAVAAGVGLGAAMFGQALGINEVQDLLTLEHHYRRPYDMVSHPRPLSEILGVDAETVTAVVREVPGWAIRKVLDEAGTGTFEAMVWTGMSLVRAAEASLTRVVPSTHVTPAARGELDDWYGEDALLDRSRQDYEPVQIVHPWAGARRNRW